MILETQKGIWFSSSFTEKFGTPDVKPAKILLPCKTLDKDMYDREIKRELDVQESTLEDVSALLRESPEWAKDGNWNIFYVAGCVVGVGWDSDDREWNVHTWNLDDDDWNAGSRVFGATATQALSSEPEHFDAKSLIGLQKRVEALEAVIKHHNLALSADTESKSLLAEPL